MIKRIIYTSIFAREYRRLPEKIKDIAEEKEKSPDCSWLYDFSSFHPNTL